MELNDFIRAGKGKVGKNCVKDTKEEDFTSQNKCDVSVLTCHQCMYKLRASPNDCFFIHLYTFIGFTISICEHRYKYIICIVLYRASWPLPTRYAYL